MRFHPVVSRVLSHRIFSILANPWALSIPISILIIYLLLPKFDKYKAEQKSIIDTENKFFWYHDIDGDGRSEEIEIRHAEATMYDTRVLVYKEGRLIDQWNFPAPLMRSPLEIGDFDSNGITEMYLFTQRGDSLFVNWFEPFDSTSGKHTRFISRAGLVSGKAEVEIHPVGLWDVDGDGFKELHFIVNSGFSLFPRNGYAWDIKNDTLYASLHCGGCIGKHVICDLNNDSLPEILVSVTAPGNMHSDTFPYSDWHCWLFAFTGKAEFLFEPVQIGDYSSALRIAPFKINDVMRIAALYVHRGPKEQDVLLQLYSAEGRLLRERNLGAFDKRKFEHATLLSLSPEKRDRLFLVYYNGEIEELDSALAPVKQYKVPGVTLGLLEFREGMLDIDGDGEKELLFSGNNKALVITRSDFSEPVSISLPERFVGQFTVIANGNEQPQLFIHGEKNGYIYSYGKNPQYPLRYAAWGGVFLGVLLFMLFLKLIQQYRLKLRMEQERKIAELQLKSITGQIDSHFNLNILNSIGSLFRKHETEKADYIFGKYAKLLRSAVLSSDRIFLPLKQELDDVENYLTLEKFRLGDVFDYAIHVDDGIDTRLQIPKMLIHTFAENAIKHGLRHLKSGGKLEISIGKNSAGCVIRVKDNGIGREKAKEHAHLSTGRGMKILDEILALHFNLTKNKITYQVNDLHHADGSAAGTEVLVVIYLTQVGKFAG